MKEMLASKFCLGESTENNLRMTMTLTLKVRVTMLPEGSVNVYVTGVVPGGNCDPGWRLVMELTVPELSVTVGWGQVTGVVSVPNGTVTVMSSGNSWTSGTSTSAVEGTWNETIFKIH